MRSIHEDTSVSVTLLTSKAKVTHLQKQTIPKLELSGAREGACLLKSTAKDLNISTEHLFCWTDSMVVLGWLSKPDRPWKQFVTVRIREVLSIVPSLQWRHVSSKDNPADHISRGLMQWKSSTAPSGGTALRGSLFHLHNGLSYLLGKFLLIFLRRRK